MPSAGSIPQTDTFFGYPKIGAQLDARCCLAQ
jgi:hypothetical protein